MTTTIVSDGKGKWRINRNVIIISFAFMMTFTAFDGAANLQSSVNSDGSAGTFALAAMYLSLILSNIFLPPTVIKWLGCKWTIALSIVSYMPFIAAQFYPSFYTLIPGGLMVGFGGGPLWCAKCTYLSVAAEPLAKLSGISADFVVTRFFGIFFMFYQMAQVWGNLMSSAILSSSLGEPDSGFINTTLSESLNHLHTNSSKTSLDFGAICGVNFCSGTVTLGNENLKPPSSLKIQVIAAAYLTCMIVAIALVAFGVDSLNRYSSDRREAQGKSGLDLLAVTMTQMKKPYQLLLMPIIVFIGAEHAFISADLTQAYVGCAYGISNIGYVMICFGASNAITAPIAGGIVKITGRYPVMVTALILNLCLLTSLFIWKPSPHQWYVFFLLAAAWGITDAMWLVQVNALCSILFPGCQEAAYSNFKLGEAVGLVFIYATAPYLCIRPRLYILLALLLTGFAGYSAIELIEYRAKRSHQLERNFDLVRCADNEEIRVH